MKEQGHPHSVDLPPAHAPVAGLAWVRAAHGLTASVAVVVAGLLVVGQGASVFVSNWRGATLGLTHSVTLGFMTMVLFAVFYRHLDERPCARRPRSFGAGLAFATLLLGVVSLGVGVVRGQSDFVFLAIAAMGIMGPTFLVIATRGLRGLRAPGAERRGLATALWSFFAVASLGIWVAHGHGGMRFPGPRPMWIQVHLCVGLLGWLGGMLCAELGRGPDPGVEAGPGAPAAEPEALIDVRTDRLLRFGLAAPVGVLFGQYFGLLGTSAPMWAAGLSVPALYAIWWALPARIAFGPRRRRDATRLPRVTRGALLLGPVCFVIGLIAFTSGSPKWVFGFGWLAIWGWAGLCVHGLLVDRLVGRADTARASRGALAAHVASLPVGLLTIAFGHDVLAWATGALLMLTGGLLFVDVSAGLRAGTRQVTGSVRSSA